jgi:hypothetical protein
MKIPIGIGLLLMIVHSAFPPRVDPESPHSSVKRAFILSPYFYYRHYSRAPLGDPSKNVFSISRAPADFDWGRYVAQSVVILSASGLGTLLLSRRTAPTEKDHVHLKGQ